MRRRVVLQSGDPESDSMVFSKPPDAEHHTHKGTHFRKHRADPAPLSIHGDHVGRVPSPSNPWEPAGPDLLTGIVGTCLWASLPLEGTHPEGSRTYTPYIK